MNPVQGIMLSLTYKTLWSRASTNSADVLYRARRCASLSDTVELLSLLENDLPSYIVCIVCNTLHRRHTTDEANMLVRRYYTSRRYCSAANRCLIIAQDPWTIEIEREAVDLALRAQSKGTKYGIKIDVFKQHRQWSAYSICKNTVNIDMEALPILDPQGGHLHLFLKTTQAIDVDLRRPLDTQMSQCKLCSCPHAKARDKEGAVTNLKKLESPGHHSAKSTFKCQYCPTDVVIEASRNGDEIFGCLTLTTYRDLGARGGHTNREWLHLCELDYSEREFQRNGGKYVFGEKSLRKVYDDAKKLPGVTDLKTATASR